MNIGILGAGNIGGNLGLVWANAGHSVRFGVRDPQARKVTALLGRINGDAQAVSLQAAVDFGEVVLAALPGNAVVSVLSGLKNWDGKAIIDATNRFGGGSGRSSAEEIADMLPGAHVFKGFNCIGAEILLDPNYDGVNASMFICGDDRASKAKVMQLTADAGFDAVDTGGLGNARHLEALAWLWLTLMQEGYGRSHAFRLLRP